MRGVEGAGAYRTGRPLANKNVQDEKRFPEFAGGGAKKMHRPPFSMKKLAFRQAAWRLSGWKKSA